MCVCSCKRIGLKCISLISVVGLYSRVRMCHHKEHGNWLSQAGSVPFTFPLLLFPVHGLKEEGGGRGVINVVIKKGNSIILKSKLFYNILWSK